jgi:hypothetical protein
MSTQRAAAHAVAEPPMLLLLLLLLLPLLLPLLPLLLALLLPPFSSHFLHLPCASLTAASS